MRDEERLHTLRMLELTGHADVPVAAGAAFPWSQRAGDTNWRDSSMERPSGWVRGAQKGQGNKKDKGRACAAFAVHLRSRLIFVLSVQQLLQLVQRAVQVLVGAALLVDLGDRVHHRGVVLVAELAADLGQTGFGHLLGQVHGDLARHHHVARVVLLLQVG